MSIFQNDPFSAASTFRGCGCGQHVSQAEHNAQSTVSSDALVDRSIHGGILAALFPNDIERRQFIKAVGATTTYGALASMFPLAALNAMAQEKAPFLSSGLPAVARDRGGASHGAVSGQQI